MKKFFILCLFISSIMRVQAQEASDPKAIEIADKVMQAMGGQKAWNETRHITWNFFGSRILTWDKWTGNVRIDFPRDNSVILMNINTDTGKVFKWGSEQTNADSLKKYMKSGKGAWINDSYWLTMPFKLRDNGVTLKYIGEAKTETGKDAYLLQMTFKEVGNTPNNMYKIYVDKESNLLTQWSYFPKSTDEKPGFTRPWTEYKPYGKIILSGERGDRDLTEIKVFEALPESIYTDFKKPNYTKVKDYNKKKDKLEL
ncbi:hypothetical protein [Emticicia sp.]|uniref:hypothetical protein n=1 Tax=Emticicia sp. TaxID=1930953 RepID=UPI003750A4F8